MMHDASVVFCYPDSYPIRLNPAIKANIMIYGYFRPGTEIIKLA